MQKVHLDLIYNKHYGLSEHRFIYCLLGLSSISWTESPMNCVQVDEASQCDISKPSDSLNVQREAQEMLPKLNDNSLSSSSGYHRYRLIKAFPCH
jgi:hypothetical protein